MKSKSTVYTYFVRWAYKNSNLINKTSQMYKK